MAVVNKGLGTVSEGAGTIGTKILNKNYPVDEGLVAGSTKQTTTPYLEEQGW